MRKNIAATLFAIMATQIFAGELLRNPSFTELKTVKNETMPKYWKWGSWGKDSKENVIFSIDGKNHHSQAPSVKITQTSGGNYCHFQQKVELSQLNEKRKLKINAWVFGKDAEFVSVVVIAKDKRKKTILWRRIALLKGSFDWREVTGEVDIPIGTTSITLSLRLKGVGSVWFDDCSMTFPGVSAKKKRD